MRASQRPPGVQSCHFRKKSSLKYVEFLRNCEHIFTVCEYPLPQSGSPPLHVYLVYCFAYNWEVNCNIPSGRIRTLSHAETDITERRWFEKGQRTWTLRWNAPLKFRMAYVLLRTSNCLRQLYSHCQGRTIDNTHKCIRKASRNHNLVRKKCWHKNSISWI